MLFSLIFVNFYSRGATRWDGGGDNCLLGGTEISRDTNSKRAKKSTGVFVHTLWTEAILGWIPKGAMSPPRPEIWYAPRLAPIHFHKLTMN